MRKSEAGKDGVRSLLISAAIGGLIAAGLTLLLLFLCAVLIAAEILPMGAKSAVILVSAFLSVTAGAAVSAKRLGRSPLPAGLSGALCFFLLILLVTALRGDSVFTGSITLELAVCALAGGAFGGLLGTRQKRRKRGPKRQA
ncbi:MAG: TIGR04086 family membrane protein [Firmicutes bacterium]|nr:TIGR04086 family membrane protein [Bacillota bacterium]